MSIIKKGLILLTIIITCLPIQAMEIKALAWDNAVSKRKLAIASGQKATLITDFHYLARSVPIKIPAGAENLRLEAHDRKGEEGEILFIPLKVPENVKHPLLEVMVPGEAYPL